MMKCRTVLEQIENGEFDTAAHVHLDACPTCRAEWQLRERLVQALAAGPRVAAPASLSARVMAEVRQKAPASAPARSARPSTARGYPVLRPWEMGGLTAFSLALLALVPAAVARWGSLPAVRPLIESWSDARGWIAGHGGARSLNGWDLATSARVGLERLGEVVETLPGASLSLAWLGGMTAFALGLYLLLSWRHVGVPSGTGDTGA